MKLMHQFSPAAAIKTLFVGAILLSTSTLFAQVKIGTNPTTIDPANNLEVESATAGHKVSIDKTIGKVTIADGTQKAGRVYTSDGNGTGSWQAGLVFAGYAPSQSGGQDNAASPISLIPDFDPESAWDNANNEYTLPEAGYYTIAFSGVQYFTDGYSTPTESGGFTILQSGVPVLVSVVTSLEEKDMPLGGALAIKAAAGDKIKLVSTTGVYPGPQTWTVKKAALTISKTY